MPTLKKRIALSVTDEMSDALSRLAKLEQVPTATMAETLLRQALEIREDIALATIAEAAGKDTDRWYTHEEVWGKRTK